MKYAFRKIGRSCYKFEGKNILKFATYFLAGTKERRIKISFEHKDFNWLVYEKAQERLTFKNSKEVLKKAHYFLKK